MFGKSRWNSVYAFDFPFLALFSKNNKDKLDLKKGKNKLLDLNIWDQFLGSLGLPRQKHNNTRKKWQNVIRIDGSH